MVRCQYHEIVKTLGLEFETSNLRSKTPTRTIPIWTIMRDLREDEVEAQLADCKSAIMMVNL